jgi:MFS family permease
MTSTHDSHSPIQTRSSVRSQGTSVAGSANGSTDLTNAKRPPLWQVLQNPGFLLLWGGQVFSQLADKVYLVLMIALITSQFQSEGQTVSGWVSSIMVAFTIPAVLFGSVAGVLVDRWSKKWVMVLTNLLRGGLVLLLPFLLWLLRDEGTLLNVPLGFWAMLGVTFLVSTLTQFFAPAEQAVIPLIVDRPQLLSANSIYTLTMMLAVIVGFAAGDPLLELAEYLFAPLHASMSLDRELLVGGSYAIAGFLLLFLRTKETSRPAATTLHQIWADIRDGLRFLRDQRRVRGALIQLVILFSLVAALAVLVVRLAEILPEIEASEFGFLLAAGGLGMAAGIALLNRLDDFLSYRQIALLGSLGMGFSLGALAFTTQTLWISLCLLAVMGVCAGLVGIPMQTTIQEQTPEEMRGKVFGLQNNLVNIALSLPLALAGVAEALFGIEPVLLGLAGLVMTGGLLTWYISDTANA